MTPAADNADFLVYKGIIIAPFPRKFKREKLYEFMERNWDVIMHFKNYIDKRQEDEDI